MALMTCRDLSLGYDGDVLVRDLNFEVNAIDVSDMAQGAYFVRISGQQQSLVRKLIVK